MLVNFLFYFLVYIHFINSFNSTILKSNLLFISSLTKL